MKRRRLLLKGYFFLAIFFICPALTAAPTITSTYNKSLRGTVDSFPFLLLRGTPAERGRAYGVLAAKEIISSISSMVTFIEGTGAFTWAKALTLVTPFSFSSRFTTELTSMFEGIKEALPQVGDRQIKPLNREISLEDLKVFQTGDLFELAKCSQFSAWGKFTVDQETIIGRNWDYPDLYPIGNATIFAVDPAEPGLKKTIDSVFFGLIGAGLFVLNEDGSYFSANDGSIDEGKTLAFANPVPATLALRMAAESSRPDHVVEDFVANLQQKVAMGIIFHASFPMTTGLPGTPNAIEYDPRNQGFGIKVRAPESALPQALIMTNHFLLSGNNTSGDSVNRYGTMKSALQAALANNLKLGFSETNQLMDAVSRSNTLYTGVIWPKARKFMVATAPSSGVSATKGTYHTVEWDEIFNLVVNPSLPSAPTELIAQAHSTTQIDLSWTDTSTNETSFKVEQSSSGNDPWQEIKSLAADLKQLQVSGLTTNTHYFFRVKAVNGKGSSGYSNVASAKTLSEGQVTDQNLGPRYDGGLIADQSQSATDDKSGHQGEIMVGHSEGGSKIVGENAAAGKGLQGGSGCNVSSGSTGTIFIFIGIYFIAHRRKYREEHQLK